MKEKWEYSTSQFSNFISYGKEMVQKVCEISYRYSTVAIRKIDDVIRVNGLQKLSQYMSDDEGRAKIRGMVYFSAKFVKNAVLYSFKEAANILIPGGRAVAKIFSETVREIEIESQKNNAGSVALDGAEMLESRELKLGSENTIQVDSFSHQTAEDVLRVFMMMEFVGTRYLDNLLIPAHRQREIV
ncbi:uncharacterized protein LOC132636516 [Lycium barbarum]|uniref:uncharacterized protein LOC132636516 n=1 Tax=Lycium barbarum TaxID=112863 RepID=UPI00293F0C31|nr:uncharacterized protein LOC132636516 [Lycium barbarum]